MGRFPKSRYELVQPLRLGSVGEWVWRNLAGIKPDEDFPGYKHFFIQPRPGRDLAWVKARYDSIRGPIVSEWKMANGRFELHVGVPANTTATVYLPAKGVDAVVEGGAPVQQAKGVTFIRMEGTAAVLDVQSGRYDFVADVGR